VSGRPPGPKLPAAATRQRPRRSKASRFRESWQALVSTQVWRKFSLPVGQVSDDTPNARGSSQGSKTGLPLQCTRLDTVSSPGAFRVSSPACRNVPSLCRATKTLTLQPARTPSRDSRLGTLPKPIYTVPQRYLCDIPSRYPYSRRSAPCAVDSTVATFLAPRSASSTGRWRPSRRRLLLGNDRVACFGVLRSFWGGLFLSMEPSYSCREPSREPPRAEKGNSISGWEPGDQSDRGPRFRRPHGSRAWNFAGLSGPLSPARPRADLNALLQAGLGSARSQTTS
jgi:hypothetical protein